MNLPTPTQQRDAMMRRLDRRIACEGKVTLPAVPSLLNSYVTRCEQMFAALGRSLSEAEREQLRSILKRQLGEAFSRSQRATITLAYSANIGQALRYTVTIQHANLAEVYEEWVNTRKPPYFGLHADAKVLALAGMASTPAHCSVLDIGAGTGRNALALARLGHPVDAIELTPKFAHLLAETATQEALPVRVICEDVFRSSAALRNDYELIVVSEVVPDFRAVTEWRALLELAERCLKVGGKLVVNVFVTGEKYFEDQATREFAQLVYSFYMTPAELACSVEGLKLLLVSSENVHDYEQAQLPSGTWPPTPWYPDWTRGRDLFALPAEECPVSMRWLVLEKIA